MTFQPRCSAPYYKSALDLRLGAIKRWRCIADDHLISSHRGATQKSAEQYSGGELSRVHSVFLLLFQGTAGLTAATIASTEANLFRSVNMMP